MKRALIFAHYDKDNIIDDYIIYYLRALKQVAETVIFVSCNNIENPECLTGLVDKIIDEPHNEYDFGSYKRGFLYLQDKLNDYDELIFANDSCYGPLYPLENIFVKMGNKKCDFWGITKNRFGIVKVGDEYKFTQRPHLQSYFLVFKKAVYNSIIFRDFISSIKHYDNKNEIILNYEIGLTEILHLNGFSSNSYINSFYEFSNILIYFWRPLIEYCHMPFLKCSVLRNSINYTTTIQDWQNVLLKYSNYPIAIIEKNLSRTQIKPLRKDNNLKFLIKKYFCYFIGVQPKITKKFFIKLYNEIML